MLLAPNSFGGQAGFPWLFPASAISGASPHKQVPRTFRILRGEFSSAFILTSFSTKPLIFGPFPHDRLPLPWDQTPPRPSQRG